jgi:hypothetical protein
MKKNVFLYLLLLVFGTNANVLEIPEQRDLQLLKTYQQEPGLISAIKRTSTKLGFEYLTRQVTNPLADIAALKMRQEWTKQIMSNPALQQSLQDELKAFANAESSLNIGCATDDICQSVISNFYFKNKYLRWLNKYPAGLELGQIATIANLSAPLIEHAIIHFFISKELHERLGICKHPGHHHHDASFGAQLAYNAYNIAHTGIHLIGAKGVYDHVKQQADIIKSMQSELIKLRHVIESARTIVSLVDTLTIDNVRFPDTQEPNIFHSDTNSAQLEELLDLLTRATFVGDPSFVSRPGNILRAYALAQMVHHELRSGLAIIGAVDFQVNCARLMQENKPEFVFADFIQGAQPLLRIKGFWNPLVADMQPIDNELILGTCHPHIALVTGPNKAGKSTGLAAMSTAVILAQSLGIVPAQYCALAPFSHIKTGFNMTNRVNHGQSLFSTSLDFARDTIAYAKNNPHQFVFIATDELFNSTEYYQGLEIAANCIRELAQCSNCIALMATHFAPLTALEEENPAVIKNYKAELTNTNCTLRYSIEPGISEPENVLRLVQQDLDRSCGTVSGNCHITNADK